MLAKYFEINFHTNHKWVWTLKIDLKNRPLHCDTNNNIYLYSLEARRPPRSAMTSTNSAPQSMTSSFPNVLQRVHEVEHRDFVLHEIDESFRSISQTFYDNRTTQVMQMLNENLRTATHSAILAVFFALLNVDANLKQKIYKMDEGNACKIERFLIDLKFNLILTYFSDEAQSTAGFVEKCFDAYILS